MKRMKPIKGSVLLKRAVFVVLVSLLLTVVSTVLLYGVLSRAMFSSVKYAELKPKARALAGVAAAMMGGAEQTEDKG